MKPSGPAPPATVGCFHCGEAHPADETLFEQCAACGQVCGLCLPCSRVVVDARAFLEESMEWHEERACRGEVVAKVEAILAAMRSPPAPPAPKRRTAPQVRPSARAARAASLACAMNAAAGLKV